MNIFLFGASGRTGLEVSKRLLEGGHSVKALVRTPEKYKAPPSPDLKVIKGDVFLPETYRQEMQGTDVVISCLGIGKGTGPTTVYSKGGENILDAMRAQGVKRLMVITSALVDTSDPGTDNFFLRRILRPIFRKLYADMALLENRLDQTTDIDWICVRPTGYMKEGFTGKYRVNLNYVPKGGLKISRADVADFIVKQLGSNEFVHRKPVVAY